MSFSGPNELWISADRNTKLIWNPGTEKVEHYVNGVKVSESSSSVFSQLVQSAAKRVIVADGAAVTLTAADSGALCVFDKTDGALFNLPTAEAGLYFDFIVDTVVSSGSAKVLSASASEFIKGLLISYDTDTSNTVSVAQVGNGTTHRAITMNGTTTGGIAGTRFRLTAISATQWLVEGYNLGSGVVATPFATS